MWKKLSFFTIGTIMSSLCFFIQAQVTIGSGQKPEKAALLDLKSQTASSPGGVTATSGGLLLPRVELTDKSELLPFFNISDIGTSEYENTQKPAHTGLMVYHIGNPDFPEGTYIWNGTTWRILADEENIKPDIEALQCGLVTLESSSFYAGVPYQGIMKIPYSGGNGGRYSEGSELVSIGQNSNLKARLKPGKLEYGFGYLIYDVYGTPEFSSPIGATFEINFGTDAPVACQVEVGKTVSANLSNLATLGPLMPTTDNGAAGYARDITTPDGKFSIRAFVPKAGAHILQETDIQIRNNTSAPITIMWNALIIWRGASNNEGVQGNAGNVFALNSPGVWTGNGTSTGSAANENLDTETTVITDPNTGWGDRDVYASAPEQRSYIWTTTDVDDKTMYHMTFMMGAPTPSLAVNDTNVRQTKVFIKIEQIQTLD